MTGPPPCPFGTDWESLRLTDLRAFLRSKPQEAALWEAKRNDTKAKLASFVRKECCGFANRRGGYLVLGAEEREGGEWKLTGIDLTVKEIHDWVASLLLELSPPPPFDVREWGLSNGRRVAVVQVEPSPLPPVTHQGVVYQRHGTQTIRADGPAIRRLTEQGAKLQRRVETKTRKLVKELSGSMFVNFALGLGRLGERTIPLSSEDPERTAYRQLREALRSRWPKRELNVLTWGDRNVVDFQLVVLTPRAEQGYTGWRAAWEMIESGQAKRHEQWRRQRARRRFRQTRSRAGAARSADKDYWMAHIDPAGISAGSHWQLPGDGQARSSYGERALAEAEVLLRGLIGIELELDAASEEPIFTCLALRNPWGGEDPVFVESWNHLTVSPRAWRLDAATQASYKMALIPPPKTEPAPRYRPGRQPRR